ncbi:activator-dependent family glycosyltransferase [Kitasatospora sp. NPDC094011]|uniref:activator-dependent family glycosyltransferase n=1 Tax=Kitasatospora sp. NPDC094011 TaxID=3364090 RepID=UPI00382C6CD8
MRVLFTVFPATAHVYPIVPLAWALQNAGHDVRVAIHPDAVDLVTDAGLTAIPLGRREILSSVVEFNSNLDLLDGLDDSYVLDTGAETPRWEAQWHGMTQVLSMFTPLLQDLVDLAERWRPDLVLWDPFCPVAAVAARITGAAQARILWGQDNIAWLRTKSKQQLAARGAMPGEDPVNTLMAPMLSRYGLDYDDELLLGQWTIDPMPAGMRLPLDLPYQTLRRVPYNGAAVVPDWVLDRLDRPRVCLTLGVGGRGRQVFRESGVSFPEIVATLAELDIELVATIDAKQREQVTTVPDNVRLVDYVPLSQLLPTCSAIIHHGGGGTFAAAVAHQVPQLITPMPFWGEHITAQYVADRGAGLVVPSAELTAGKLRDQLSRLLTEPAFGDGVATLYREMREAPGPAELVPVLEDLTTKHRS